MIATVLFTRDNHFTGRATGYICQLAVDPAWRRFGLGQRMMDWCEDLARSAGLEGVQLDTAKPAEHLVRWYLSHGYRIVGETRWEGKTYESWVFEKLWRPES